MKSKKKKGIQMKQGEKFVGLGNSLGKGQFWISVSAPTGWVLDNTELS